jgi:hypothetical protein
MKRHRNARGPGVSAHRKSIRPVSRDRGKPEILCRGYTGRSRIVSISYGLARILLDMRHSNMEAIMARNLAADHDHSAFDRESIPYRFGSVRSKHGRPAFNRTSVTGMRFHVCGDQRACA